MKWQIFSSDQALYIHSWDNEEYVVYNSLTGDTHLLNLTAGRLLLELQQSPTDTLTLVNLVTPTNQAEPGTQHKLEIENILEHKINRDKIIDLFRKIGIVISFSSNLKMLT